MTIKKILPFILLLLTTITSAQIERDSSLFRGVIMEGDSLFALPYAKYVINNKQGYTANEEGQFSFWAKPGDIVKFSYVGFDPLIVQVNDSLDTEKFLMGIFLSRDTIELSEIIIIPQNLNPSAMARNLPILSSQDDIAAQQNIAMSTYQAKTQPVTKWDAEMNQKNFIQARTNDIVYRTQVQPSQMVGVSNISTQQQIDRSKMKNLRKPRRAHITQEEWEFLISSYREKMRKKMQKSAE
ncbi:carboxypeptidase-like regulatory domain-containing protein [Labilibacter sediminis]|nr:carboxypeptidase-like regulatory domain-containing protein [Labilibacter sediminis]